MQLPGQVNGAVVNQAAQELGPYTALASLGIIAVLTGLLLWLITKYIPGKDVSREEIAKEERESRERMAEAERVSREHIIASLSQAIREFKEELTKQLREDRESNQKNIAVIHEKMDRFKDGFHELAMTIIEFSTQEVSLSQVKRQQKSERAS